MVDVEVVNFIFTHKLGCEFFHGMLMDWWYPSKERERDREAEWFTSSRWANRRQGVKLTKFVF